MKNQVESLWERTLLLALGAGVGTCAMQIRKSSGTADCAVERGRESRLGDRNATNHR